MRNKKSYSELMKLQTFEDRYAYLRIGGKVGESTFGFERYLNQLLYHDKEWEAARRKAIIRDSGKNDVWDLGTEGYPIGGTVFVHHINPVTKKDILERAACLFDPENLISCSKRTHDAIHYGDSSLLASVPKERSRNDTCPWKTKENYRGRNQENRNG